MDKLGSEVFNLKLALQEYEDRLANLYQTEDRSKWKGPATLLVSLQCLLRANCGAYVDSALMRSKHGTRYVAHYPAYVPPVTPRVLWVCSLAKRT